jgi:hypothetical protein
VIGSHTTTIDSQTLTTGSRTDTWAPVRVERRRRDGLGMVAPTQTPERQRNRERANRAWGFVMFLTGAFLTGGTLALLRDSRDGAVWLGLFLGLLLFGRGVRLLARRERRKGFQ